MEKKTTRASLRAMKLSSELAIPQKYPRIISLEKTKCMSMYNCARAAAPFK
jgi:hypothetical protein